MASRLCWNLHTKNCSWPLLAIFIGVVLLTFKVTSLVSVDLNLKTGFHKVRGNKLLKSTQTSNRPKLGYARVISSCLQTRKFNRTAGDKHVGNPALERLLWPRFQICALNRTSFSPSITRGNSNISTPKLSVWPRSVVETKMKTKLYVMLWKLLTSSRTKIIVVYRNVLDVQKMRESDNIA